MTNPILIAVGSFPDWDMAAMNSEFALTHIADLSQLDTIDQSARDQARAVAFKSNGNFNGEMMDKLPNLKIISNFGVGYDAIDVDAASQRGIKVTNTPDVLDDEVADLAVAMLIAQSRQIVQGSDHVRSGRWAREGEMAYNRKVSGGTAGILGLGRIGREIADRLTAFKIGIHYHTRTEKQTPGWTYHADPVSLARAVDYLFIVVPGGAATDKIVSAEVLKALGSDGILVNISRGSTVDEEALIKALHDRTIRGAALDVFNNEPKIDDRFLGLDNVLLQPHQGSATFETRKAMGALQRANVAAYYAGEDLLTPVN